MRMCWVRFIWLGCFGERWPSAGLATGHLQPKSEVTDTYLCLAQEGRSISRTGCPGAEEGE